MNVYLCEQRADTEVAPTVDFLRAYLPKELSREIDFNSLTISDTEKENKKHKKYYLDLCVDCLVSKTQTKIYIIFEHKSYYDKLTLMLKEIVTLDDDRVIRLFEYIVVNKDIEKEKLKELIIEMKGENTMPTLAQRWLDEGKAEGIQIGLQQGIKQGLQQGITEGIFETAIVMIKDFQIAIDDVVAKLNIKKEELLEYMQTKKYR